MPGENKRISKFYVASRERGEEPQGNMPRPTNAPRQGMLGNMLNAPMERYMALHPEMACRWEFAGLSDGNANLIPYREGQGYHVIQAEELNPDTPSAQKSGPIRKGDLVLMAAPKEVHEALLAQDHAVAEADFRTPELSYKQQMQEKMYRTSDGNLIPGAPFGKVTKSTEEGSPDDFVPVNSTPIVREGGESQ